MAALWGLCFFYLWALVADALYVQPGRRLKAALARRTHERGTISSGLRYAFPVVFLLLLIRTFVLDVYHVPSSSMYPMLEEGDRIWVDRLAYGLRWPLSGHSVFLDRSPGRGELIVFRYPREPSTMFVKRVIGVAGDGVRIEGRLIELNGAELPGPWRGDTGPQTQTITLGDVTFEWRADFSDPASLPPVDLVVPAGHYFVMGDNLDHSRDSREWGLVSHDHLVGRAALLSK